MAQHSLSRFDYLFEPVDGDVTTVRTSHRAVAAAKAPRDGRPRFLLALTAAIVVGAGVGLVTLLPRSADAGPTPSGITTTTPPIPVTTISPVDEVPTQSVPAQSIPAPAPEPSAQPEPAPVVEPTPQLQVQPAPPPRQVPASTPITRAPISVSPEPRPAFPNQKPDTGSDDHGLLGGLL